MGCEAGELIPSLEGWPSKAKEAPSPHEVRLTLLNTNPIFLCLSIDMELPDGEVPSKLPLWSVLSKNRGGLGI